MQRRNGSVVELAGNELPEVLMVRRVTQIRKTGLARLIHRPRIKPLNASQVNDLHRGMHIVINFIIKTFHQ